MRILLLEDSKTDAYFIRRAIDHLQPEVDHVVRLQDAERQIEKVKYDLILSDLRLPDSPRPSDTIDRVIEAADCVPVILITGDHNERTALEATIKGAYDFRGKELHDLEKLARLIPHIEPCEEPCEGDHRRKQITRTHLQALEAV